MCNPLIAFFFRPLQSRVLLLVLMNESKSWINAANSSGLTPLKAAVMQSDATTVSFLIANGAIVDIELLQFAEKRFPRKREILALLSKTLLEAQITVTRGGVSPSDRSLRRRQVM